MSAKEMHGWETRHRKSRTGFDPDLHQCSRSLPQLHRAFLPGWRRQRRTFSDKEEAVAEARVVNRTISAGHAQALDLTTSDREAFHRAKEKLAEFGVTLDEAIREFIEAKRLLQVQPLTPAADTFARLFNGVSKGAMVPTIVQECLKAKTEYGLSKRYLKQLGSDRGRHEDAAFGIEPVRVFSASRADIFENYCGESKILRDGGVRRSALPL